ncbi:MAG: hypothetical protein GC202_08960 [Alphaproteobacteria bacterium]|nr:hypothetical protein [Alphaproteobacteria bacterium]
MYGWLRRGACAALSILAALLLEGCAARTARVVDIVQPHDELMGCEQLQSEISATRRMAGAYDIDNGQQSERNQLALLGALVNPIILMNADAGDAATQEAGAFGARAAHLENLRQKKECKNG